MSNTLELHVFGIISPSMRGKHDKRYACTSGTPNWLLRFGNL